MRALRSCDFCDAQAVGAFEVVPPELEPTEAEQRRVVLCGDCKDQLEDLLEPLLARAGAAPTGADGADSSTDSDADADVDADADAEANSSSGTVVATADDTTQKRRRTTSPNATVSDSDSSPAADTGDEPASETSTSSTGSADAEPSITFESDTAAAADSSEEPSESATDAEPNADADADSDSPDESGTDAGSATRPPQAYGKVIRLLRNREFPVDRDDAAELAAGAYDIERAEVDAIIDHAVANDEFVDRDGQLHRA